VNYTELKDILLSKDLSRVDDLQWTSLGPRFLDGKVDMTGNNIGFCSYPRSGNTFMKKFIEQVTGVVTGGEIRHDLHLYVYGLFGEGHACDNRVWLTKTHHPGGIHQVERAEVDKQIVLMRNPMCTFYSYHSLGQLGNHSLVAT
jgi:hypothetical protein